MQTAIDRHRQLFGDDRVGTLEGVVGGLAAEHLDLHARTLAGGSSKTLGLIVSNLQNPFFLDIFRVFEADAQQAGYAVVVANTDYRPQQPAAATQWMLGHRLAGLALVVSEREPALIEELASDVSVVGHDNIGLSEYTAPPLTTVDISRAQIGHAMAAALLPQEEGAGPQEREIVIHPEVIVRDSTRPAR